MIDSSPMYGYSQDVIGASLREQARPVGLFSATKVWIPGAELGERQIELAQRIWGVDRFDLVHVHNMLDWQAHLGWLSRWRDQGKVRYIGITTSHGRRHEEMEQVIREEDFDFVQFTYNIIDREAEQRLLPLAQEHGKAVVINRPLQGGALFAHVPGRALPDWAAEIDCSTWSQFFLKFVVSHPAVTCAIPATSRTEHLLENMAVLSGRLPKPEMREEMAKYFAAARS
jgi:diketogulonate reductase-like aldo/keto reductase